MGKNINLKSIQTLILLSLCIIGSCKVYKPDYSFESKNDESVDYSNLKNWASHPRIKDEADYTPEGTFCNNENLKADVFFLHPTTYTGEKYQDKWNAPIADESVNQKTDKSTIRFQASAFNYAGKVYAPRYRQAHLHAYFSKDKASAKKAFDLAYEDIKSAFEYFLNNENNGRPIIIASHSQGTNHAEKLLEDYFNNKPLQSKLVAAYLLGMPVKKNRFSNIFPCKDSSDTGCYVSWRTFKKGYKLPSEISSDDVLVTNPISWQMDERYISKTHNKGTLLFDFNKVYPQFVDAQVHKDILWATKPKFRGSIFFRTKNYHPADVNFYYFNIRENAKHRVDVYLKQ